MKKLLIIMLAFLGLAMGRVCAQTSTVFGVGRELSSSLINYLYQDSHGRLWVATEEGLNCFDGNKFRQFRHVASDPTSICSNFINFIFENEGGELIICTNRGMQVYDPATRRFSPRIKDADGKDLESSVTRVVHRSNGDYWVIGDSVRVMARPGKKSWEGQKLSRVPESCSKMRNVTCGISDPSGNLWLSMRERGLWCIGPTGRITKYFGHAGDPFVVSMAIGKDGQLYLGTTSHGLLRFNSDTSSFTTLSPSTGKAVQSLYVESDGRILQATDGSGIVSFDPSTGLSAPLLTGNALTDAPNAKTHYILRDDCGNLWVGIFQTGVVMVPGKSNAFGYIGPKSASHNVIGHNCVSSIFKDSEGILWVGADNDGIYALNPDLSLRSHFTGPDISVPMCVYEDSRKNIWVGTYLKGVGTIDRNSGAFRKVELPVPTGMCFAITEDRDHNLWLGMMNSGLVKYSLDEGKATTDFPWRSLIESFIASLYYSAKTNTLYVGTYSGLQIVKDLSLKNPGVTRVLERLVVHSIDEDDAGRIWMGTTDGLVVYDPKTGKEQRYGVQDGLNTSTVYGVRCVGKCVWMSTTNGIGRLDTETGHVCNFYAGDGLQGNEFYKNSVFRDREGHLYFGGTGGITHFNPHDIETPGRKWTPRIIDIYAQGQPIDRERAVNETTLFRLKKDENTFSVEFGTRELGRPETVRFAYSLDGKTWEVLPMNTYTVNFYDLDPGDHTLRYKAIDGYAESAERTVKLAVAYPWYSAPLSKVFYVVVFIFLLWLGVQGYAQRMRSKAQLVELRHSDQLNEARIRSYVNISHEIRTPMSLIISPLKKLMATDDDPSRQKQYNLIMRNAKRVLRLIDELMDLRKIEKHQMELSFLRTPLVPFIQDICDTFAHTVADNRQELVFTYDDASLTADVDIANLDKILMNLFSNAVKYTPQGGRIEVLLSKDGKDAVIKVLDTGVGIPEEDRPKIFDRFYRVNGNVFSGTGVGLHLAHQLAELHGGSLEVGPNPEGEGSCFTLRIPLRHKGHVVIDPEIQNGHLEGKHKSHMEKIERMQFPEPAMEEKRKNGPGERVLIVEDDDEIREYLAAELSPYYKVETSADGREALDLIFRNPPAIILSDVMMPGVDGIRLTKSVKQNINLNYIPVVLVSALTRDEDAINAIAAGADAYFTKPFNIEVIKERMKALLNRYRQLKNIYSGNQEHDNKLEGLKMENGDEKLMRRVVKVINDNLDDPELSVEKLAAEVGLSRVHLHRKLKSLTNQSPSDFIRNTRLRQAAALIREKKVSVSEAAYATGFNSASTFSIAFKRLFGVTPTAYAEAGEE